LVPVAFASCTAAAAAATTTTAATTATATTTTTTATTTATTNSRGTQRQIHKAMLGGQGDGCWEGPF